MNIKILAISTSDVYLNCLRIVSQPLQILQQKTDKLKGKIDINLLAVRKFPTSCMFYQVLHTKITAQITICRSFIIPIHSILSQCQQRVKYKTQPTYQNYQIIFTLLLPQAKTITQNNSNIQQISKNSNKTNKQRIKAKPIKEQRCYHYIRRLSA